MTEDAYSAKDITVLEGLEPVRLRPGMYIGSTGQRGLHHLVYEVVDNSVDEALAGRNDRIEVTLHPDHSVTVRDWGHGIPVDFMPIVHEQMVHRSPSEDLWFRKMLGIDVGASPLPKLEKRLEFIKLYAEYSGKRLAALQQKAEVWWEEQTMFRRRQAGPWSG